MRAEPCARGVLPGACAVTFAGQSLDLLPERAVWWAAERTLLIADLHLGKPASFRDRGAPVPEAVTRADLDRLGGLLARTRAHRLVVLGDLAHDRAAWRERTLEAFAAWRAEHAGVEVVLVRGNHDRWAADPPASLSITVVDPGWRLGPIAMHHEPVSRSDEDPAAPVLCGHLHPGVSLRPRGKGPGMRSACFWFAGGGCGAQSPGGPARGVLPAFGVFTGCAIVEPREGDRVFAVGAAEVLEVKGFAPVSRGGRRRGR